MKSYDCKRLKKRVFSFLRKLVRDEISLMQHDSYYIVRVWVAGKNSVNQWFIREKYETERVLLHA